MPAAMPLTRRGALSAALRRAAAGCGRITGERGQNLVEFALVVPILSVFLFAIVEFGNVMRVQIELDQAVRAGARYASINYSTATWSTVLSNAIQPVAPGLSGISGSLSYPTACPASDAKLTLNASYTYAAITPVGGLMRLYSGSFSTPTTITSTSTMHSEC